MNKRKLSYLRARGIHESLLKSADFSFDWHSRLVFKGLRSLGLGGAISLMWHLLAARLFGSHS